MIVIVDGESLQEFSVLYVNLEKQLIVNVFHFYVKYPFVRDEDIFARRHVHGLNRMEENGCCLLNVVLLLNFNECL